MTYQKEKTAQNRRLVNFLEVACKQKKKVRVGKKYGNKKTTRTLGGEIYEFDSLKEARRFDELVSMYRAGEIEALTLQPEYEIAGRVYDKQHNKWLRARKYVADFRYVKNGRIIVEDVKSNITKQNPVYTLKKQLFLERYGHEVEFREV